MSKEEVIKENINKSYLVARANQLKRKHKLIALVEKKAEIMDNEVQDFKDRCEVLYKRKFPPFFDGHAYFYSKESLTKILNGIMEDQMRFGEENCPFQEKDILNLYKYHFELLFMLKRIFME